MAWAGEGFLGTKKVGAASVVNQAAPDNLGMGSFLQMTIALLIVFGLLKWVLPGLMNKIKMAPKEDARDLRISEQVQIGPITVCKLRVGDRLLLIGCSAQSVALLADLTNQEETPQPLTFAELLESAPAKPEFLAYHEPEPPIDEAPEPPVGSTESQLLRLQRLLS